MVRHSKILQIDDRAVTWEIQLFEGHAPIDDELEKYRRLWARSAFINELPVEFDEDGIPKPSVSSSMGTRVPILSRELWLSRDADYIDSIKTAIRHIRMPKSPVGEKHPSVLQCDAEELIRFLVQPEFVATLRLWVFALSNLQFKMASESSDLPDDIIEKFIVFSSRKFGSFSGAGALKLHKRIYRETGFVQIGYIGQEDSR